MGNNDYNYYLYIHLCTPQFNCAYMYMYMYVHLIVNLVCTLSLILTEDRVTILNLIDIE